MVDRQDGQREGLPRPDAARAGLAGASRQEGVAQRLYRLASGLRARLALSEGQALFALTAFIGVVCGLAAVGFHLAIDLVARLTVDRAVSAGGLAWIPWTIAVPALGGLLSGILLDKVVPNARGSGIPLVKTAYAGRSGPLRSRDSLGKFVIGAIQIGTGASLGREGPTVQICAGIASRIGRFAGVSPTNVRRLIPVGVAAGIAAAFNAPIAAVTFTIEEVVGSLDQTVLSGVIVAAALAAIVERSVLGVHPIFSIPHPYGLDHPSSLLLYAALGLVAAGLSIAFTDSLLGVRAWFSRQDGLPRWVHPAVGSLATGVLAVAVMGGLGVGGVTGGGYEVLDQALSGKLAIGALVALSLVKLVATVLSYSSGGAGGIFAPSLFIGGMAGGAIGTIDLALFHHSPDSLGAFALVGMGAVFAGIIRAPITSVLIIVEMTGGYSLILPLMIANMLAYGIARHYRPTPIYEALLEQDGITLRRVDTREALDGVLISRVPLDTQPFVRFTPSTSYADLLEAMKSPGRQEVFPVVDGERMVGVVTLEDLIGIADVAHLDGVANASDLMRPPLAIGIGEDLRAAYDLMLRSGVREVPVLNEAGLIVGFVDERSIARALGTGRFG